MNSGAFGSPLDSYPVGLEVMFRVGQPRMLSIPRIGLVERQFQVSTQIILYALQVTENDKSLKVDALNERKHSGLETMTFQLLLHTVSFPSFLCFHLYSNHPSLPKYLLALREYITFY